MLTVNNLRIFLQLPKLVRQSIMHNEVSMQHPHHMLVCFTSTLPEICNFTPSYNQLWLLTEVFGLVAERQEEGIARGKRKVSRRMNTLDRARRAPEWWGLEDRLRKGGVAVTKVPKARHTGRQESLKEMIQYDRVLMLEELTLLSLFFARAFLVVLACSYPKKYQLSCSLSWWW